jgi:cytochrome c oxidase subunit III
MRPNKVIEDSELVERRAWSAARPHESFPYLPEVPQRTYFTGITVAIAWILSFFMALVSAYIVRKGSPAEDWRRLTVPHILWLNTAILVASGFALARSRKHFLSSDESGSRHWLSVTAVLGLLFLAGQMIAWRQLAAAGIYLSTNPSSSFFYFLTAAHGLYLFGGIAALLIVAVRPTRFLTRRTATGVISIYWHFMGGLWILLFLLFLFGQ